MDMIENLIWLFSIWGCAGIFTGIGIHAGRMKEPMWFWSGTKVPSSLISDIPSYNRENRKMWCIYSIPFWITGISFFWYPVISAIIMSLSGTLGIAWLIWYYRGIEKRYKIK